MTFDFLIFSEKLLIVIIFQRLSLVFLSKKSYQRNRTFILKYGRRASHQDLQQFSVKTEWEGQDVQFVIVDQKFVNVTSASHVGEQIAAVILQSRRRNLWSEEFSKGHSSLKISLNFSHFNK